MRTPKAQFFSVVDFDKLQHYKHRSPPWIKLYADLWEKSEFERLPDESKAHFLGICILASKFNNRIPQDLTWLERHLSITKPLDLNILFASGLLAPCKQNALSEKSRVEKSREKTEGEERGLGKGEPKRVVLPSQSTGNGNGHRPSMPIPFVSQDDPEERAQAARDFHAELARLAQTKKFP